MNKSGQEVLLNDMVRQCEGSDSEYAETEVVLPSVQDKSYGATRKRPCPFGVEIRTPTAKWIRFDTPIGASDVITATRDRGDLDGHVDQGTSSGVPSPVDEDEPNHSEIDQRIIFLESDETTRHSYFPLSQYASFPALPCSIPPSTHLIPPGNDQEYNTLDILEPFSPSNNPCSGKFGLGRNIGNDQNVVESSIPVSTGSNLIELNSVRLTSNNNHGGIMHSTSCVKNGGVKVKCSNCDSNIVDKLKCSRIVRNKRRRFGNVTWILSRYWRRLLKNIKGFILVLNSDLAIVFVSENVIDHLGFHQNEMIGQQLSAFIQPSYLPLLDYIKTRHQRYNDGHRPLEWYHSTPIPLRYKHGGNCGYRTVHWHVGFKRSNIPSKPADYDDGGDNNERDDENSIVGVCIPAITESSSSLLPTNKLGLIMLGKQQRHWMNFYCGREWAYCCPLEMETGRMAIKAPHFSHSIKCLPCFKSLLKTGYTVYKKTSHADNLVGIWCVPADVTSQLKSKTSSKCAVCCKFSHHLPRNQIDDTCRPAMTKETTNRHEKKMSSALFKRMHGNSDLWRERKKMKVQHAVDMNDLRVAVTGQYENDVNNAPVMSPPQSINDSNHSIQHPRLCYKDNYASSNCDSWKFYKNVNSEQQKHYSDNRNENKPADHLHGKRSWQLPSNRQPIGDQHGNSIHQPSDNDSSNCPAESNLPRSRLTATSLDSKCKEIDLSNHCIRSKTLETVGAQNSPLSNVRNQEFGFEIGLGTEFSFDNSDVVTPVDGDGGNGLVWRDSSSSITDISSNNYTLCDQSFDSFTSQNSKDFTYSFEDEIQSCGFQTAESVVAFPSSDVSQSPANVTSHNSFNCSNVRNTELYKWPNSKYFLMDDIVPGQKNPFIKDSQLFQQPVSPAQSHTNPLRKLLVNPSHHSGSGLSLLRSILDKSEEKSSSAKVSRRFSGPKSYAKSKYAIQTKELPYPQSHSSQKRRLSAPPITQELPIPNTSYSPVVSPIISSVSSDNTYRNKTNERTDDLQTIMHSNEEGSHSPSLNINLNTSAVVENDIIPGDSVLGGNDEALPDDIVDLAMEYCDSLDSKDTESIITEFSEQFGWLENMDLINTTYSTNSLSQTSYSLDLDSTPQILGALHQSEQLETSTCLNRNQRQSNSTVCLPLTQSAASKLNTTSSKKSDTSNAPTSNNAIRKQQISLLRQAVTSPNVDKLIEKIPLGRKFLSEKYKPIERSIVSNCDQRHQNTHTHGVQNGSQNLINQRDGDNIKYRQFSRESNIDNKHLNQSRQCISNFIYSNTPEKTAGISHISISQPPNSPKKSQPTKHRVSPVKLKISAASDITRTRRPNVSSTSSTCSPNKATKSSSNPNSSSEGVSVLVMRRENHRSRKSKTVSTQTENHPGEVYPALELSDTDTILTPSIYLDTPSPSPQSIKSPASSTGNKSPSYNTCNVFSSSLRSLIVSPRDSKEMTVPSPCPSHASTSSSSSNLSELELHLRGWSGPDSNLSSPQSSEASETASDVPFLQRLLTGELSKDRYEKLDKDLLTKERSGSSATS